MFKSMKIIIFLIISVIITMAPIWYFSNIDFTTKSNTTYSKDVKIYQADDEQLQVIENITVDITDADERYLSFPISIYKEYTKGYTKGFIKLIDTKITLDNIEVLIEGKNINEDIFYSRTADEIRIYNSNYFKTGRHSITISYKCNIKDAITNYNNISVLNIRKNTMFDKLNVAINLPRASSKFDVNSNKAIIENVSNSKYNVNLSGVKNTSNFIYSSFLFDNNIFPNANLVDENYITANDTSMFIVEKEENIIYFLVLLITTITLFIITMIITKKVKLEKKYVRDPKDVLSPMLAESLIDGKMGSKELIMTCIVELICRGNLQNIDNDKFKLISKENLLDYEKQLINMIFGSKSTISFNEINEMFKKNNKDTKVFVKQFKQIKKKILDKLFDLEIFSKKSEYFLKQIRNVSILVYINIIILFENILYSDTSYLLILAINIIALVVIKLYKPLVTKIKKSSIYNGESTGNGLILAVNTICLLIMSTMLFKYHYMMVIMIAILVVLNTITIFKSKLHVLTKKGKEEYAKAYGLKSYIVDFSLMDERDIDSAIIWDEYLAYAVAFSIPNKIINRFNSALMEANIIIQNIDKFLAL